MRTWLVERWPAVAGTSTALAAAFWVFWTVLGTQVARLETRMDRLETRMDRLETRMEVRIGRVEERIDQVEQRLDRRIDELMEAGRRRDAVLRGLSESVAVLLERTAAVPDAQAQTEMARME